MKTAVFSFKTKQSVINLIDSIMTNSVIISFVVVVLVIALIVFLYLHKRHVEYNWADIEQAVRNAYPNGVTSLEKEALTGKIKKHFHCSTKEAHYLIGVARRKKLVDIKQGHVDIIG